MKYWMWGIATVASLAVIITASVSWWALQRTRVVPDFYERATQQLPADLDSAVARLEQDMVQLQGDAAQLGSWQAVFTDEQINAWLVQQLPREFPNLLPPGVEEPRIIIEDERILVAARYKSQHIDTVVSFEVSAALTEQAYRFITRELATAPDASGRAREIEHARGTSPRLASFARNVEEAHLIAAGFLGQGDLEVVATDR